MAGLTRFERALALLSPAAAGRRALARDALREVDQLLGKRGYDAAKRVGRHEGWRASGASANAEIGPALDIIRRRSRDMANNDAWCAQICAKLPAKMVGSGIVPRAKAADQGTRERARDAWESFVENSDPTGQLDFYGQSSLVAATVVRSGEALVRWHVRVNSDLRVPLQCEVLEPDYLDTRRIEVRGDNVVINGVEFDPDGRRVAYWLFPVHPGEVGQLGVLERTNRFQSQRVEAGLIDHVYRIDRPGQVRGVPWLAPVLIDARDTAEYEEAERVRKKIAACLAFFVKTSRGSAAGIAKVVRETAEDGKPQRIESVKPGRIHYLDPDETVEGVDPAPSTGYAEYLGWQLRRIAAGVGMTYEAASGDLSKVNYSSIREGKLDFWELLDGWQYHMLIPQHARPAWRRVMALSSMIGLKVTKDQRAIYAPPKRPWVDPLKDIQATLLELRAGLASWPDAVGERGGDPEDQLAEILAWVERLKAAGISFEAKAAAKANGKAQPDDGGEDDDETEGQDDDDDAA